MQQIIHQDSSLIPTVRQRSASISVRGDLVTWRRRLRCHIICRTVGTILYLMSNKKYTQTETCSGVDPTVLPHVESKLKSQGGSNYHDGVADCLSSKCVESEMRNGRMSPGNILEGERIWVWRPPRVNRTRVVEKWVRQNRVARYVVLPVHYRRSSFQDDHIPTSGE